MTRIVLARPATFGTFTHQRFLNESSQLSRPRCRDVRSGNVLNSKGGRRWPG
jgi:hypothetical protein